MTDRYRNYKPKRQTRRKNRRGLYALIFIAVVIWGGRTAWGKIQGSTDNDSPQSATTPQAKSQVKAEPISNTTWNDLNQRVTAIINQNPSTDVSVAIIDINSNTKANYGIQETFQGASTTKVLTAAAYLKDVEQGRTTLSETLGGSSAETHLRRMINRSDNNSWAVLNSAIGYNRLDSYARSIGIGSYRYIGNLMTAGDQALLLSKLFKYQLLNDSHTKLLLSYMQNTNNEDMIPKAIPGGTLYHKYGLLEDRLHDSGILNYKGRPIVLVIYTKGSGSDNPYGSRAQLIQEISRTVFTTIYAD